MMRANEKLNTLFDKDREFEFPDNTSEYKKEIFEKRDEIINFLENLDSITDLEYLEKMSELIENFERLYTSKRGSCFIYPAHVSTNTLKILDRIYELTPKYYDHKTDIDKNSTINGYNLYGYRPNPLSYNQFLKLCKIWKNLMNYENKKWVEQNESLKELTKEEFFEVFKKTACTNWNKQDQYGEYYGGYWEYPENSYEKENAYELSRTNNMECLWELPYPKRFIIETINIGCSRGNESVRYSNYLGHWMESKIKFMDA